MSHIKDVLTTQQAAKLLGISTTSVQKMVSQGELMAWVTPGGHRRIFRTAVDSMLESNPSVRPGVVGDCSLRVLLVQDDTTQIAHFKSLIARSGHAVRLMIASDAVLAAEQLSLSRPHLLVAEWPLQQAQASKALLALLSDSSQCSRMGVVLLTTSGRVPESDWPLPPWVVAYPRTLSPERMAGYLDAMASALLMQPCEGLAS